MEIHFRFKNLVKLFDFLKLKSLISNRYYDYKAKKVIETVDYKIIGACKQCGQCCKKIFSTNLYYKGEFDLMQKDYPEFKRFEILGISEQKKLVFWCKMLGEDNKCSDYENRLDLCKKYPFEKVNKGRLFNNCGFKKIPVKEFSEYLKD